MLFIFNDLSNIYRLPKARVNIINFKINKSFTGS